MKPRPRDLTDRTYMATVADEDLLNVIKHSGAAVGRSPAMMAFEEVRSGDEIADLVAFIRTLCCPKFVPPPPLIVVERYSGLLCNDTFQEHHHARG
jgi:hypothetical protein